MQVNIINRCKGTKTPRKFLVKWVSAVSRALVKHKILSASQKKLLRLKPELVIVFVSSAQMKKINKQFRGKEYATDVLSFTGEGLSDEKAPSLGELVLCAPVIKRQAREHGLAFEEELGYMVLHGMLHLLGFDHELSKAEAARMFKIQDEIFEKLS
ncbi:MAG: rRNA maturation RNase YbeY [Bdellovibrionota bacterium]